MTATLNMRVKVADPKPAYCSACLQGARADVEFYDFQAAFDGGTFVSGDGRWVKGSDDLYLCEDCLQMACETAGLNPQLHGRQGRRIKQLELEIEHWKATVRRTRAELEEQVNSNLGPVVRRK